MKIEQLEDRLLERPQTFIVPFAFFLLLGVPNVMSALLWTPSYVLDVSLPSFVNMILVAIFVLSVGFPTISYCSTTLADERYSTTKPVVVAIVCSIISSLYAILLIARVGTEGFGFGFDDPKLLTAQVLAIGLTINGAFMLTSMMRSAYSDSTDTH